MSKVVSGTSGAETKQVERIVSCKLCNDYHYEVLGCCSGFECGCGGRPVDALPCQHCNPDGKKEPSDRAVKDYPFLFDNNYAN